jgi:heterodisulfide reductase subunit C
MIRIYIMGKEYKVPEGLTIMKAMEYAGYKFIRGAGCRAGFCGACPTVYRLENDYKLYTALACQTTCEDGMYLAQIPFTPAARNKYDLNKVDIDKNPILQLYPEIARCVCCNTCTKACPQELEVMDYIQAALRGDLATTAQLSFDCIQCGLCTVRCPAEISHYHVAQLARRLYGKYLAPKCEHLDIRVREITDGKFDAELDETMKLPLEKLKEVYSKRKIEGG